jgi:UDP-N-acetylmuramoyl-tripeptide--D-alanyl-D-alanine ligase
MDGTLRPGDPDREFDGVSIDTRTLTPGELFFAIRGERFNGADFARAAIDAGAGGVVVERGRGSELAQQKGVRPLFSGAAIIEVDDAIMALQALAQAVRRASGTKVVAITGSAGKTTTKEVTGEFLAARYSVVRNRGNFNNHIGLPLSLIDLRRRPEIAVVELGMNHAGEISTLVRIAEPEVRVWTNVGEAHLGFFQSLDAIADAKSEICEGATPASLLIANADDDRIAERASRFGGRLVTFGIDRDADVRATEVRSRGIDGTDARIATPRGAFELTTPLIGRGNLANVLAATAVAIEFDVPLAAVPIAARCSGCRRASRSSMTATTPIPLRRRAPSKCSAKPGIDRDASPCSAKCSSWASAHQRSTKTSAEPRPRRMSISSLPSGASRSGRWRTRPWQPASDARMFCTSQRATRRRTPRRRSFGRATSCS